MSSDSLNVVALVSGGKDSFFSILHCLKNGHKVVALANLYPPDDGGGSGGDGKDVAISERDMVGRAGEGVLGEARDETSGEATSNDEEIDSHMYQTVGSSIIPLYATALNLPLYRHPITGSAVNKARDYSFPQRTISSSDEKAVSDETESLLPLLTKVLSLHPEINALSTGAILSSYQRTRIESVALRLNLTPLGYLWQYPYLPPYSQHSLLSDMAAVGQDARIIKVASGGLDERCLWLNVADVGGVTAGRLAREMGRFGGLVGGSVLGEGGEYETLAVDGPGGVWKGRIVVEDRDKKVIGGGGVWSLRMKGAKVVEKEGEGGEEWMERLRVPEVFDVEFERLLRLVEGEERKGRDGLDDGPNTHSDDNATNTTTKLDATPLASLTQSIHLTSSTLYISNLYHSPTSSPTTTPTPLQPPSDPTPQTQFTTITTQLLTHLTTHALTPSHITHTTILLRSMSLFNLINTAYATLFTTPNPPSRVTIACGECLPEGVDVVVSVICQVPRRGVGGGGGSGDEQEDRIGLHVQSRSYWAPANIGPYSQGISVPLWSPLPRSTSKVDGNSISCNKDKNNNNINNNNTETNNNNTENNNNINNNNTDNHNNNNNNNHDENSTINDDDTDTQPHPSSRLIHIAGQIPLTPSSMSLHSPNFTTQALLSLQHLWRIGRVMHVDMWISCVAYITATSAADAAIKAKTVGRVWRGAHARGFLRESGGDDGEGDEEEEEEEEEDIAERSLRGHRPWADYNHNHNHNSTDTKHDAIDMKTERRLLPNWAVLTLPPPPPHSNNKEMNMDIPPIFIAQVADLPRASSVEWAAFGIQVDSSTTSTSTSTSTSSPKAKVHNCKTARWDISHIYNQGATAVLKVASCAVRDAGELVGILDEIEASGEAGLVEVFVCGSLEVKGRGRGKASVMVVPCRSVWTAEGEELVAGVRWRWVV